jgi:selenocysteine lyase/cysteine desulfurase
VSGLSSNDGFLSAARGCLAGMSRIETTGTIEHDLNARIPIAQAQEQWSPAGVYLNTASYGLPPRVGWEALQTALEDWRGGRTSWEHWGDATDGARTAFARLVGADARDVTVGATVSGMLGLLAASLPAGSRVVVPEIEFTSTLFPFLVQERLGRCSVRLVPADGIAEAIDAQTDAVAFSAVQMSNGQLADLDGIADAARAHGATTIVDATQAIGWLPLDATRFDAVACAAYKWLMSPRGTAFMYVRRDLLDGIVPVTAGWYGGDDVHASYFGPPLRLAETARRLDTSPAWFSWVGTRPALELLGQIGIEAVHAHDLRLANRFRAGLGLPAGDSAIVSIDAGDAGVRLERAGVMAATRGGRLRTSWHLYNTEDDVDRVLELLRV